MEIKYVPSGPVIKAFLEDVTSFVRVLIGPYASGKTVAGIVAMLMHTFTQRPGPDGIRRSRWAVIRDTYPNLKNTTLKSFLQWLPEGYGKVNYSPPITYKLKAGDVDFEIIFLAMDKEEDESRLLSLELTGALVDEARTIDASLFRALAGRVGRYPAEKDGGSNWAGIILVSNPPDQESDLYRLCEVTRPDNWSVFKQPGGLDPKAENLKNLRGGRGYYENLVQSAQDEDWIKVFVNGEYGFVIDGRPVYGASYKDSMHCKPMEPASELKLILGLDLGVRPALVITQYAPDGQWRVLDEIFDEDRGLQRFAERINEFLAQNYAGYEVVGFYDPSGIARGMKDGKPIIDAIIVRTPQIRWRAAPTNDFTPRRSAIVSALSRLIDGQPGLVLNPRCSMLRRGFVSRYHFPMLRDSRGKRISEIPVKNDFSHVHDALQYAVLSGGGYDDLYLRKKRQNRQAIVVAGVGDDPFSSSQDIPRRGYGSSGFTTQKELDEHRARGFSHAHPNRGGIVAGTDDDGF